MDTATEDSGPATPDSSPPPDSGLAPDTAEPAEDIDPGEPDATPAPDTAEPPPLECTVFPPDNAWNTDISDFPVHPQSAAFIQRIGGALPLHPDFGTVWGGAPNGLPWVGVPGDQPKVEVDFSDGYGSESDPGPYAIPPDAPIEGGPEGAGDRHVIAVDMDGCMLYELFAAYPNPDGSWKALSGAIFDMTSNDLRPIGWTSADAAGLPILPGLVRYDEVAAGAIEHALRFTVATTQKAFVLPATHWASSHTDADLPPMGLRFRLKADVDISGFSEGNQVILKALKTYGMILADNGGNWFLSGEPNPKWIDDDLHALKQLSGSDFEVVDTGLAYTTYDIDLP